jgi:hypothetical protein
MDTGTVLVVNRAQAHAGLAFAATASEPPAAVGHVMLMMSRQAMPTSSSPVSALHSAVHASVKDENAELASVGRFPPAEVTVANAPRHVLWAVPTMSLHSANPGCPQMFRTKLAMLGT